MFRVRFQICWLIWSKGEPSAKVKDSLFSVSQILLEEKTQVIKQDTPEKPFLFTFWVRAILGVGYIKENLELCRWHKTM